MFMKKKNALVVSIIYHVGLFNNGVLCVSSQFHIFNIGSRIASDAYIESRAKYTYFLRHFSSILFIFYFSERTEIQKQKIIYKIKEKSVTQQNQYKFISCRFFLLFLVVFFLV